MTATELLSDKPEKDKISDQEYIEQLSAWIKKQKEEAKTFHINFDKSNQKYVWSRPSNVKWKRLQFVREGIYQAKILPTGKIKLI